MNLKLRTGLFVGLAAACVAACLSFGDSDTAPEVGVIPRLPERLPGHLPETGVISEAEKQWLPKDTTFVKRSYLESWLPQDEARYRALHATLIIAGSDSRSLHRPRVCLTAQGWAIRGREVLTVETKGGPLEVMDYQLARVLRHADGSIRRDENGKEIIQRAHYVYWWVGPDSTTASDEERVWLSVWGSILKGVQERWAYPSVMTLVDERLGERGEQEARERILDFIRDYAPMFQKSLGASEQES